MLNNKSTLVILSMRMNGNEQAQSGASLFCTLFQQELAADWWYCDNMVHYINFSSYSSFSCSHQHYYYCFFFVVLLRISFTCLCGGVIFVLCFPHLLIAVLYLDQSALFPLHLFSFYFYYNRKGVSFYRPLWT